MAVVALQSAVSTMIVPAASSKRYAILHGHGHCAVACPYKSQAIDASWALHAAACTPAACMIARVQQAPPPGPQAALPAVPRRRGGQAVLQVYLLFETHRLQMILAAALAVLQVQSAVPGPCDIYAKGGTPCVAAHSMTRALFDSYAGPLCTTALLQRRCSTMRCGMRCVESSCPAATLQIT